MEARYFIFIAIAGMAIVLVGSVHTPHVNTIAAGAAVVACPVLSPSIDIKQDDLENRSPSAVFNQNQEEFLVTWTAVQGNSTVDVWAARVGLGGRVLSTFNVATKENEGRGNSDVAYSPDHDQYLIAYGHSTSTPGSVIKYVTLNWSGSSIEAERAVTPGSNQQYLPSVVYNSESGEFLVVYENSPNTSTQEIIAQRIRAGDGQRKSWRIITTSATWWPSLLDLAYSPWLDSYLIVYRRYLTGGLYTWASTDLSLLDAENNAHTSTSGAGEDRIAVGPGEFLYVWSHNIGSGDQDIQARYFDEDGIPQGPTGGFIIAGEGISNHIYSPQVAFAGNHGYLVVWTQLNSYGVSNIYGSYVPLGQGQKASAPFPIFEEQGHQDVESLVCTPWGECLVVILDRLLPVSGGDSDIRGKLVKPCAKINLPYVVR